MATVAGKRVRRTQPQPGEATLIDWSNPITRDMTVCLMHGDQAYGHAMFVNAGAQVVQNTVAYTAGQQANTPQGTGGRPSGTNPMYTWASNGAITSPNYSLFAFGTCASASVTQSAIDMDNSSERYFQFRLANGKVDFIPFNSAMNATLAQATSPVAMTAAEMFRGFTMGATAAPGRTACFQNGAMTTATYSTGTMKTPGVGIPISIGARATNAQQWSSGALMLVVVWMRTLTDAEMQSLSDNPWQLFKPQARRMWVPRAVSAAYVLQATVGTFALSVAQAALLTARRLGAATGALTSSWAPASLLASRRLPGASASFAMSGTQASIIAARKIAASAGAFSMLGTSSPMVVSRRVAGQVGAFALSAGAASLVAARRLPAQPGVFVLSPGAVQMVYTPVQGPGGPTYTLTAIPASFALTTTAAGVLARRRLAAMPAAFAWSGTAASLLAGRRVLAGAGAFGWAGGNASMRAARVVPAQAGSFSLVGATAQLHYSAQVSCVRGPTGAGYAPQQHYNESRPATTSAARHSEAGQARPAATGRSYR